MVLYLIPTSNVLTPVLNITRKVGSTKIDEFWTK